MKQRSCNSGSSRYRLRMVRASPTRYSAIAGSCCAMVISGSTSYHVSLSRNLTATHPHLSRRSWCEALLIAQAQQRGYGALIE